MEAYTPFLNNLYNIFESAPAPKVEINLPLLGLVDISDWSMGLSPEGIPLVKPREETTASISESRSPRMIEDLGEGIPTGFLTTSNNVLTISSDILTIKLDKNSTRDLNAMYAFTYLISHGIPRMSAAGIVGNFYYEGRLHNPTASPNPDSKGTFSYGIAQFNSGGEYPRLMNWAKKRGISGRPNFDLQLDYIIDAINSRNELRQLLNSNITASDASYIFGKEFERFAGLDKSHKRKGYLYRDDPEHVRRAKMAENILTWK